MPIGEKEPKQRPFEGMKIYYSGSIRGVPNAEPDFAWNLVRFLTDGGANVLSEHVGARTRDDMDTIFQLRTGVDRRTIENPWFVARAIDIKWVDEATHLIAVVNGSSHGVGMEIERAIHKTSRGLNQTPILCLIQEGLVDNLTWMIRGVSESEAPGFRLSVYKDLKDAQKIVAEFLAEH